QAILFLQLLRRLERLPHGSRIRDDRKAGAFSSEPCLPDGNEVVAIRQLLLDATIEILVLEEQHRILIADGGLEQPLRVARRGRVDDLEPERMQKGGFRIL